MNEQRQHRKRGHASEDKEEKSKKVRDQDKEDGNGLKAGKPEVLDGWQAMDHPANTIRRRQRERLDLQGVDLKEFYRNLGWRQDDKGDWSYVIDGDIKNAT